MNKLLFVILLCLGLLVGCQSTTVKNAAPIDTVYVHGRAPVGTLIHIYYPTGGETDAKTGANGYWGQTVARQNGTFTLIARNACVTDGPAGAVVHHCRATFKLPDDDTYGDFVVEAKNTPTVIPTSTPIIVADRIYECARARHVQIITQMDGSLAVLVVCDGAP